MVAQAKTALEQGQDKAARSGGGCTIVWLSGGLVGLLQRRLGGHDGREGRGLVDGELGQDLAVELDPAACSPAISWL